MFERDKLKSLINRFKEEFSVVAKKSRDEYMQGLKGGDRLPPEGKIYGEDYRRNFAERAQQMHAEAEDIVNRREAEIGRLMAAAPSQDAVSTISLLKMRNNVGEDELNAAFDEYGENYQAYKVLCDIAADNKIRGIEEHPLAAELEGLEGLKKSLASVFSVTGAESGRLSDGFLSMLEAQIDGVETGKILF